VENYQPHMSFGKDVADIYDDAFLRGDEPATVRLLEQLAGEGPVLELAIGTGRIAVPLARRGIRVDGIDLSPAMVEKLRAKEGGDRIAVTMGDFADVPVQGVYPLIYLVFNGLFLLGNQADQVRCFENVAAHLTDDGVFVVEAFVPSHLHRLTDDQYVDAGAVGVGEVRLDVGQHDPVSQRLDESQVFLTPAGIRMIPIASRYAWPSELDLMARIAGLQLRERWAGWNGEPYDSTSDNLVSVFGRRSDVSVARLGVDQ
jgi:SAM-dependent methyltransferase